MFAFRLRPDSPAGSATHEAGAERSNTRLRQLADWSPEWQLAERTGLRSGRTELVRSVIEQLVHEEEE